MVESKLVELVVAGSSPVGHPISNLNGIARRNASVAIIPPGLNRF